MKQQRKKTKPRKRMRIALIVVPAIIVIIAIIITLFVVLAGPDRAISNKVNNAMNTSQIGQTVNQVVSKKNLLFTMIMPASNTWWQRLGKYATTVQLSEVPYAKLGSPTSLGLVDLYNANSKAAFYFATPVVFVAYSTNDQAAAVVKTITADNTSETPYYADRIGNNVVLIPNGNIDTETFVLKNYKPIKQTQPVTQAYWHISWNVLAAYTSSIQSASYQKTYAQVLSAAGLLQPKNSQVYWDGISTDGASWVGENNSDNNVQLFKQANFNPKKSWQIISDTISNAYFYTKQGDKIDTGISVPHQSAVKDYVTIQSSSTAAGFFIDPKTGKLTQAQKLSGKSDLVQVTIDPSKWFQYMLRDTSDAWILTSYQKLTISLHTSNNSMNMQFTDPITPTAQN